MGDSDSFGSGDAGSPTVDCKKSPPKEKIKIYFQKYPGTDAASGISGVSYTFTVAGETQSGSTSSDGSITLEMPAQATGFLNIFGTDYSIRIRHHLEAISSMKGVQRRLDMLGYHLGSIDGVLGKHTDRSVLNFQADNNPLDPDGGPGPKTQPILKSKVGE